MRKIILDKVPRIIKLKRKLEKELDIKITNKGKEFSISGSAEDEYLAEKIIEALNMGFPLASVMMIRDEDYIFEIIKIKDYSRRKELKPVKARIIGKAGKTLKTLSNLTECFFEIKDYDVGIIGDVEHIKSAQEAIISLIRGAKQANVYTRLEKQKPIPILDLGLREKK